MTEARALLAAYCLLAWFIEARRVFVSLCSLREYFQEEFPDDDRGLFAGGLALLVLAAPVTLPFEALGRLFPD